MRRGRGKGGGRADAAKKDVVCILAKCVENCAPGVGYLSIPGRAEQSRARSSDDAANSFYQSSCSASSTNQGHNSMREGCRSRTGVVGRNWRKRKCATSNLSSQPEVRVEQLLPHCARRRLNWGTNWAFAVRCFLSCFGCFQAKKYYPTMARKKPGAAGRGKLKFKRDFTSEI